MRRISNGYSLGGQEDAYIFLFLNSLLVQKEL